MKIDRQSCSDCAICIPFCPAKAVTQGKSGQVEVQEDLCFECGVCLRSVPCPTKSFIPSDDTYGRRLRAFFSNPYLPHDKTLVPGRGTEEVKTNDVTNRIQDGEVGLCIEFGRPVPGCTFKQISVVAFYLIGKGLQFEQNNPLTYLMDKTTGKFPAEIENERILSAILEVKCREDDFAEIIPGLKNVFDSLDAVIALGLVMCNHQEKNRLVKLYIEKLDCAIINAKGNFGLGRFNKPEERL